MVRRSSHRLGFLSLRPIEPAISTHEIGTPMKARVVGDLPSHNEFRALATEPLPLAIRAPPSAEPALKWLEPSLEQNRLSVMRARRAEPKRGQPLQPRGREGREGGCEQTEGDQRKEHSRCVESLFFSTGRSLMDRIRTCVNICFPWRKPARCAMSIRFPAITPPPVECRAVARSPDVPVHHAPERRQVVRSPVPVVKVL